MGAASDESEVAGDVVEVVPLSAVGGVLKFEIGADGDGVPLEDIAKEAIDGHPEGSTPVAVAAEEAAVALCGEVFYDVVGAIEIEGNGAVLVVAGERTDAEVGEELGLVEDVRQHTEEAVFGNEREVAIALLGGVGCFDRLDVAGQVGAVVEEPVQAATKRG